MHMTAELEPLMTPDETAGYLRVSKETLATWRCTERRPLPFVKVGSLVRYRRDDVTSFIKAGFQSADD
jgi:excisionase family DNA binding protein